MFKWLPCFALLRRKSGNACCNNCFLQKNSGHALPCGSSSSHALNYSLSPTCGTASTWVHQPCTKLLRSRVTVDYPDRTAAVMPNEPSNHKTPSFPAVSWTDEATIISLFSQLPLYPTRFSLIFFLISSRKPQPASAIVLLSQRRKGDVGTPILSHTDLACNTSYHFAASRTVFPRVSPYHGPGPFAPFGSRI